MSRRIAYILVIHAMDEAGKLLTIMKKMIELESSDTVTISVEGFYNHTLKGSQAGSIGVQATEWLQSALDRLGPSGDKESSALGSYRTHLERLKEDFSNERERALYVDFDHGNWISPSTPEESDIAFDASLLSALAAITLDTVGAGESFEELNKLVQHMTAPSTIEDLVRRIKVIVATEKKT